MNRTLNADSLKSERRRLKEANLRFQQAYPGESADRQPVHTVYGGAHLFRADAARKLGAVGLRALREYAPTAQEFGEALEIPNPTDDAGYFERIYTRVIEKLEREPVEDFRIDFEDGYGNRPDAEEDQHAQQAAREVARGMEQDTLPPFIGIRIKPLNEELCERSLRTLDIFLTTLVDAAGRIPENFVITLPKVPVTDQVSFLVSALEKLEIGLRLPTGALRIELMIELTQTILDSQGRCNLPILVDSAKGRCAGLHFGTYDYTASCNITAAYQDMMHPSCDFAKQMMQTAFSGSGIWLSDGATNVLPVAPYRPEPGHRLTERQRQQNRTVVQNAWRLHYRHARHSLLTGFYQGWDLHPGQLPSRYAAVYSFFAESLEAAGARLSNFLKKAAQATLVGDVFDDAATGQGLLNYFLRGVNCGAITPDEATATGVTLEELRGRSFVQMLKNREELEKR